MGSSWDELFTRVTARYSAWTMGRRRRHWRPQLGRRTIIPVMVRRPAESSRVAAARDLRSGRPAVAVLQHRTRVTGRRRETDSPRQIVRASCRESGFRYVLFPVVPDSEKK